MLWQNWSTLHSPLIDLSRKQAVTDSSPRTRPFSRLASADLTVAVEAGMILAALVYIRKVTQTTTVSEVTAEYIREGHAHILQDKEIPSYVSIFRIHGPFLFGATDKLDAIVSRLDELPPIVILRLRNMTAIDSTGLQALEKFADQVHESGRKLILCGAREQPAKRMQEAGLHGHLGRQNVCLSVTEALDRAKSIRPEPSEQRTLARGEKTLVIQ
jgi:SulP family sulfate permease